MPDAVHITGLALPLPKSLAHGVTTSSSTARSTSIIGLVGRSSTVFAELGNWLSASGHRVLRASDVNAWETYYLNSYAAVVVSELAPGEECAVLARLNRASEPPPIVIALTERNEGSVVVAMLHAGADVCVRLPCSSAELVAWIAAALRRTIHASQAATKVGGIVLDPVARRVVIGNSAVTLTGCEYAILEVLLRANGAVVPIGVIAERICAYVPGTRGRPVRANAVAVHVHHLRRKLAKLYFQGKLCAERGAGYSLLPAAMNSYETQEGRCSRARAEPVMP